MFMWLKFVCSFSVSLCVFYQERRLREKLENLYSVTEPFSSDKEGYLSVFPGQVVELLEEGQQYCLVCTVPTVKGELESEGFLPQRCLRQLTEGEVSSTLAYPVKLVLNVFHLLTSEQLHMIQFPKQSDSSEHSQSATISPEPSLRNTPVPSSPPTSQPEYYYAAHDYNSAVVGTVNLKKGQKVTILEASNEKWWLIEVVPESQGEEPSSAGLVPPRILHHLPPEQPQIEDERPSPVGAVDAPVILRDKLTSQQLSSNAAVMPANLFGPQGKATPDHQSDELRIVLSGGSEDAQHSSESADQLNTNQRPTNRASPYAFFPRNMDVAAMISMQEAENQEDSLAMLDASPAVLSAEQLEVDFDSKRASLTSQPLFRSSSLPTLISREGSSTHTPARLGSAMFLARRQGMVYIVMILYK